MKKSVKVLAGTIAFLLIFIIMWFANSVLGNPVSKMIATKNVKEYINEKYSDLDIEVGEVFYNFKDGNYHVEVTSHTSKDTHFSISVTPFGKIRYDYYENNVLDKYNTYYRLNDEYGNEVDKLINKEEFLYKDDIHFGEIMDKEVSRHENYNDISYGVDLKELELDKDYDLYKLGKEAGHIVFYAKDDEVSIKKASEILLYIKNMFDENNISFYAIDLTLDKTEDKGVEASLEEESINIVQFLYEDIYEKNLEDRVNQAVENTKKYYERLDNEKLEQMEKFDKAK